MINIVQCRSCGVMGVPGYPCVGCTVPLPGWGTLMVACAACGGASPEEQAQCSNCGRQVRNPRVGDCFVVTGSLGGLDEGEIFVLDGVSDADWCTYTVRGSAQTWASYRISPGNLFANALYIGKSITPLPCECGASSVGSGMHSNWCPVKE